MIGVVDVGLFSGVDKEGCVSSGLRSGLPAFRRPWGEDFVHDPRKGIVRDYVIAVSVSRTSLSNAFHHDSPGTQQIQNLKRHCCKP